MLISIQVVYGAPISSFNAKADPKMVLIAVAHAESSQISLTLSQKRNAQRVYVEVGLCFSSYSKLYCELNFNVNFWRSAKLYTRRNYEYSLVGLQKACLLHLSLLTPTRFFIVRKVQRYKDVYQKRLTEEQRSMPYASTVSIAAPPAEI